MPTVISSTNETIFVLKLKQGKTFDWLSIEYPGDVTNLAVRGQIRPNYPENGETEWVIDYSFQPFTYTGTNTIVRPYLGATITADLKIPPSTVKNNNYSPGLNCWVTDIELYDPTNPDLVRQIYKAFVVVESEVTIANV